MNEWPNGIIVNPGKVQINDGYLISDYATVKVYQFDLRTKYAIVQYSASYDNMIEIVLGATDETLYADGPNGNTEVVITLPDDDSWYLMSECSRYTLTVIIYKYSEEEGNDE